MADTRIYNKFMALLHLANLLKRKGRYAECSNYLIKAIEFGEKNNGHIPVKEIQRAYVKLVDVCLEDSYADYYLCMRYVLAFVKRYNMSGQDVFSGYALAQCPLALLRPFVSELPQHVQEVFYELDAAAARMNWCTH